MISNKYNSIITSAINDANTLRSTNEGWKYVKKGKYYTLENRSHGKSDFKLIKLVGVIPASLEKAQAFYFENYEGQKKNRDMCDDLFALEKVDKDTIVSVFKLKSKFVVSAREAISVSHRRQLSQNEFLIVNGHLEEHPSLPIKKDIIRGETKVFAIFFTKIDSNQTKIELFFQNDPRGSVPAMIMNNLCEQFLTNFEKDVDSILA